MVLMYSINKKIILGFPQKRKKELNFVILQKKNENLRRYRHEIIDIYNKGIVYIYIYIKVNDTLILYSL